ncbi:hypothetical protein EI77_01658 [Prosthecobacter fusiformis]|uniref:Peptidase M28 domain-containing protein n=1 Tax=Prosthecobacter fusiformis TaxID=48464 RepID=A0A4R7S455_9BACT|nr:hypothetical protein [Prosthecobacter fusiformis]TDU73190.1 hypothetical protein EI77_01658 [Prosthecobacter fusiformis]
MSDTLTSPSQGRWIRAALVIFPAGTIVLGIASFGFWWVKKVKVEERGYKYALALRRDLNEAGLQRHIDILRDVMSQPNAQKIPAVAAYLDSSMGAENMGYQVRRTRFQQGDIELANVDVELTGKQRPREIVLLLATYGDPARTEAEGRSIAMLMSLAHAITGEAGTSTLRLAVVPFGFDPDSMDRFITVARSRDERFMQVLVAGGVSEDTLAALKKAFRVEETGTLITSLPETPDTASTLAAAQALKARLLKAVE